ncbi:MAG: periplasmic heavy metal sensor [Pseudomonadota bacterium]
MNETTDTPTPNNEPAKAPPKKRRRRLLLIGGLLGVAGLAAVGIGQATLHAHGFGGFGGGHHFGGPGAHHKAHFGGGFFGRGGMSEERAERRAIRMARHLAAAVDATPEQTEKFRTIAAEVVKDVYPLRRDMKTARQQAIDILTSDTVDRAKLETLRAAQMAKAEEATKRMTTALADAAETMTPEQRADLGERVKSWRELRSWWRGPRD